MHIALYGLLNIVSHILQLCFWVLVRGAAHVAAVQQNGHMLRYVPEALRLLDVCLAAVRQNRAAFQFVPEAPRKEAAEQ